MLTVEGVAAGYLRGSRVLGGTGSRLGALLGASAIAGANTVIASLWTQVAAQIAVLSLAIVVIRIFPRGLTGRR